jgi:hypothetical protein
MSRNYKLRIVMGGVGKMSVALQKGIDTMNSVDQKAKNNELFLKEFSDTGNTLKKLFNITSEKIQIALKEVREEWK